MDETKTEKNKIISKQNAKRATSILPVAALLITGLFAFLTSTDSKVNTFTVGSVDVTLHVDNWYDDDGNLLDDDDGDGVPEFAENILPGQAIEKAPYLTNDGKNDAYVYLAVEVPTVTRDTVLSDTDGSATIEGTTQTVTVYSYAIQPGYITEDGITENADTVWEKYKTTNGGYEEMFGEAYTGTDILYEIFETLVGEEGNYTAGINTSSWVQLGDVYQTDSKNIYVYKYNVNGGLLPVDDDTTTDAENQSETLFDAIRLIDEIGESSLSTIYYYVDTSELNNNNSQGTGAGTDDASSPALSFDGMTLLFAQNVKTNSTAGTLYYDEDVLGDTVQVTYENMETGDTFTADDIIFDDVVYVKLNLSEYETLDNIIPSEYYVYKIDGSKTYFMGIHESYFIDNKDNASFNYLSDIVIPNSVTPTEIISTDEPDCIYGYTGSSYNKASLFVSPVIKTDVGYFLLWSSKIVTPVPNFFHLLNLISNRVR